MEKDLNKALGRENLGVDALQPPQTKAHAREQMQKVRVMIRKIPSHGGEEGNRGIMIPESRQKAHWLQQQEVRNEGRQMNKAGNLKEGQETEDNPSRIGQEEENRGSGPAGHPYRSPEELMEDSRDKEEVQIIGQVDRKAGRADPQGSSRARTQREQISALMKKQGEKATKRSIQKQREAGTERGPRAGHSPRQEQDPHQGTRTIHTKT